jgi:DNA polymerase-3 subunit delta'
MPLEGLLGYNDTYQALLGELRQRPSHAYLLAGPPGVGKALVATALIHSLFCEQLNGTNFCCSVLQCPVRMGLGTSESTRTAPADAKRCDCCAGCVQLAAGVHPDFIRIAREPGRSDVSIEQVRSLIARLGGRPSRAPMRATLIDDAETLNLSAQNALLKTLEEPPGNAIIFLVARSERTLLDTLRSRMRLVRFGPLLPSDIETILLRREGMTREQAEAIARLSRGSAERAVVLAEGAEPPVNQLLDAIEGIRTLDFVAAQTLAQEFFASREQAAENFELIARMLEEMLSFAVAEHSSEVDSGAMTARMRKIARALGPEIILNAMRRAVSAVGAIDAMANSRLQAERWWTDLARDARGEA